MNISLPDSLKAYVDEPIAGRGYGTSSEDMRELIRRDRDRQRLRALRLDGAASAHAGVADAAHSLNQPPPPCDCQSTRRAHLSNFRVSARQRSQNGG